MKHFLEALIPPLCGGFFAAAAIFLLRKLVKPSAIDLSEKVPPRTVALPNEYRRLVRVGWGLVVGIAILAAFTARGDNIGPAIGIIAILGIPNWILHREATKARITWDEENIYTQSAWRKPRTIPITAVRSCDYGKRLQWYRVRTDGFGTIYVQSAAIGVPAFFAFLPCPTPPLQPNRPLF